MSNLESILLILSSQWVELEGPPRRSPRAPVPHGAGPQRAPGRHRDSAQLPATPNLPVVGFRSSPGVSTLEEPAAIPARSVARGVLRRARASSPDGAESDVAVGVKIPSSAVTTAAPQARWLPVDGQCVGVGARCDRIGPD